MNYIECVFKKISGDLDTQIAIDILVAELGEVGFESFTEDVNGVTAYIQKADWDLTILDSVQILNSSEVKFDIGVKEIEQVNWNQEWEKNFEPIVVDDQVSIRAPFHQNPNLPYDIVIEPKMSFGTGHHETTHLMIQHLMQIDANGKSVLDMGCGTGILAIFAEMKGASAIDAIDIDSWCYENSIENVERNKCKNIKVYEGDSSLLKPDRYDLIIANINRNILLGDMKVYANSLKENGILLLSGFYTEDVEKIDESAKSQGLKLQGKLERNNWVGLKYVN